MKQIKEFFLKFIAIYHIFFDTEYATYTVKYKIVDGHAKRVGGSCYTSDNISHTFLTTVSEYTQSLKSEIELSELDKLLNYDKD